MIRWICKMTFIAILVLVVLLAVDTFRNNTILKNDIIRLHIIANSDSDADQAEKLKVRDGIIAYIQEEIANLPSEEAAEEYIRSKLNDIEKVANQILAENGSDHVASVKLGLKEFGKRIYDTFSLPSGVYNALQIEIGDAEGENWWCVVFPGLCMPSSDDEFCQVAASAGFDNDVIETISNNGNYKIRFFFLDIWGKIENFFYKS